MMRKGRILKYTLHFSNYSNEKWSILVTAEQHRIKHVSSLWYKVDQRTQYVSVLVVFVLAS